MKKLNQLTLLCLTLFVYLPGHGQDIILTKVGKEVHSKVMEITGEVIKYVDYDNLEGPLRSIKIPEVAMIIYENGKQESFLVDSGIGEGDFPIDQKSGTFIDARDNKRYKWARIDNQIWMAENLAFVPDDGRQWAYNNASVNAHKYGLLYDWETASQVCPEGWHLPSQKEYEVLLNNSKTSSLDAYFALIDNGDAGFNASLGGYCTYERRKQEFQYLEQAGMYWTCTEVTDDPGAVWFTILAKNRRTASLFTVDRKGWGCSVRCIKD